MHTDPRMMNTKFRLRCCDATVAAMGLMVVLGGVFRQDITWLLAGS
jgi:hypothetical protein